MIAALKERRDFDSARPAAIHDDLGFNQVVGMDSAVWTNHRGRQFTFSHVIDEGTLFHLGAPVESVDVESQLRVFQQVWMLWPDHHKLCMSILRANTVLRNGKTACKRWMYI